MLSVVIPTYGQWHHTHTLLFDIYNTMPKDTEVIVIDDCSNDKLVAGGLDWWKTSMLAGRMKVITNQENLGFLRSCNHGVSEASNEFVILMNNDVRLRDMGVASKIQFMFDNTKEPVLGGINVYRHDTGWNNLNGKIYPYVGGWFLAFRKSEWEKFGGFDLRYIPYDFEDVDISTTYLQNGGKLVELQVDAEHIGGQSYTFSPEREEQTKKNQRKFEEKWQHIKKSKSE